MSVPGTVVSKGLELGTRLAIGTDKALLMAPFNAVKDTFFKKKKKKAATPAAAAAAASSPDNLSAMAQRIAQRRAEYQDRMAELRSRISLADAKQQLAQQEADEEARLAELEAEAAQKEADAAVALRGADIGGDAGAEALRRWAALRGEAVEQRIAAATIKTAGPFAKAMIMNSPLGKLFSFASQVYKEARTDPNAGAKIARLKAAADQGHPDAQKAIGMLALGKAATADAAAAQTVNRELAQQATAAAASSSGADYEPGLVPSSKRLIKAVPGADQVYDLARSGNATALSSVRRAAELVRAAEAGDESARSKIAMLGKLAAGGDKSARVVLAAIAVATAGIRESDQAARVRGDGPAPKRAEKKPEAPAAADAPVRPTFAEKGGVGRLFKDLFGAHGPAYEQGLMLKLSQR
jgi:hypothetical protein